MRRVDLLASCRECIATPESLARSMRTSVSSSGHSDCRPVGSRTSGRTPGAGGDGAFSDVRTRECEHPVDRMCDRRGEAVRTEMGLGGVEPPTSRLSGVRSNHLSYRPGELRLRTTCTRIAGEG